jgi:O-glycosyl hydrolase
MVARLALPCFLLALTVPAAARGAVTVNIDNANAHQTIEGYGATTVSLKYGAVDNVPAGLRSQAIQALYGEVKLNMGNLEVGPFESPANNLYAPANDNSDPALFNTSGFNWTQSDNMMAGVVTPGSAYGFSDFYIGPAISEGYEFAWAKALRTSDYQAYLAECAEHVAALAIHWRDAYGITPKYLQLWNEPLSGNTEMAGTPAELADIVKAAGARLRAEGFASMKFIVPAEETEQLSLDEAQVILADPAAAQYVGALAYHPYPYGSTYASVPNLLATSGAGTPDPAKVQVRNQLRDLAAQHGIPTMMVEVSHSEVAFGDFAGLRGRAIQIHDEMVYADVAAFFGMNAMWDSVTNDQHFAGRANPGIFAETDTVVLIDDSPDAGAGQVFISEMGRAIGHYARFAPRGSVRIDAVSSDPLLQVTAFRDGQANRLALVLINNSSVISTVNVNVSALALRAAAVTGEQSVAGNYWQAVTAGTATATGFSVSLPPLSVTSLATALGTATSTTSASTSGSTSAGSTSTAGTTSAGSTSTAGTTSGGAAASSTGTTTGSTETGSAAAGSSSGGSSSGKVKSSCGSAWGLDLMPLAMLGLSALSRRRRRAR